MVTPATQLVDEQTHALHEALTAAIRSIITDLPHIAAKVTTQRQSPQVRADAAERVFPAIVAAALGVSTKKALALCTASALWWMSTDSDTLGAQCGAMLAIRHLKPVRASASCKLEWFDEVSRSTTSVLETRLAERARHYTEISRKNVLASCLGETGAAYARDAAMAAHLVDEHPVEEWRRFGAVYGLMRQLHADHQKSTVDSDGDPVLVVPPLLAAHAFQLAKPGVRLELARLLREKSSSDTGRSDVLRDLLRAPRVVEAYARDLRKLHGKARVLLGTLNAAEDARVVLKSGVDSVIQLAMPGGRELIGV
ncbi:hypothetical protein OG205_16705 [Lentzea sp. NBC_00516]|uniref:hypothetical protein n=1 Tax=Lentzea sp. NBC_00516 TaxID=2903582 RepID=UPI002E8175DE|nr:hypothetical protein [Lentzea sp. NBC_00516]WUD28576.1 hypothetical protein OG205_16705 [Lentzea sp. NBC_00516]